MSDSHPRRSSISLPWNIVSACCLALTVILNMTRWEWTETVIPVIFLAGFLILFIASFLLFYDIAIHVFNRNEPRFSNDSARLSFIIWLIASLIVGIISSPFFFWFEGAQTRSPVARIKGEQRTITIALENYYLDHNAYPAWSHNLNLNANGGVPDKKSILQGLPTFRMQHGTQLATLTTPVSYLTSLFGDPFSPVKGASFCYWSPPASTSSPPGYLIWSPGPDRVYDITLDNVAKAYDLATSVPSAILVNLTYDPSNGTSSRGDVYRYKQ